MKNAKSIFQILLFRTVKGVYQFFIFLDESKHFVFD